jgi:hypothetical protein
VRDVEQNALRTTVQMIACRHSPRHPLQQRATEDREAPQISP